jgi:hypothetical protein
MSAPFRFPRAVAVTAAIFALAAAAHVFAGGSLPGPAIAAALMVLTFAPVMILTRALISAPVMAVVLGSSQVVLHGAFNALSMSAGFSPAAGEHLHGAGSAVPAAASLMAGHTAEPAVPMLVLHAAATLLAALVLARGEATLWALAAWWRPLIRLLTGILIHSLPPFPAWPDVVIVSRWRSLRLPALRGPPFGFPAP